MKFLEVLKYLFLGLLQGITEVLPISSSGHLQIANEILKIQDKVKKDGVTIVPLELFLTLKAILFV